MSLFRLRRSGKEMYPDYDLMNVFYQQISEVRVHGGAVG